MQRKHRLHGLWLAALLLGGAGCATSKRDFGDDSPRPNGPSENTALERPGTLPRPPTSGLPAELRPPR